MYREQGLPVRVEGFVVEFWSKALGSCAVWVWSLGILSEQRQVCQNACLSTPGSH